MIYKLKGQQIQWVPVVTEAPSEILWNHNGNKVVEFDGTVEHVYGSFEGRVTLNRLTAQLQITDLRLEDNGTYDAEIYLKEKWLQTSFELKVIGKAQTFVSDQICSSFNVTYHRLSFNKLQIMMSFDVSDKSFLIAGVSSSKLCP